MIIIRKQNTHLWTQLFPHVYNEIYSVAAGHDCSMRLWNLETKTCIQEISAHRKKFDESIHDVAFHPSKPFIASVGADGVAKVFV